MRGTGRQAGRLSKNEDKIFFLVLFKKSGHYATVDATKIYLNEDDESIGMVKTNGKEYEVSIIRKGYLKFIGLTFLISISI